MHPQEGWFDKPIERIVGIAPEGVNGSMLFFADKTAFGITAFQREQYKPKSGDLFTLYEDGSVNIRKPE